MLTCKEHLEYYQKYGVPPNQELWFHGLDLMDHLFQGDVDQTFWHDRAPVESYLDSLREAIQRRTVPDERFEEIVENSYLPKEQWTETWDESGQFELDSWLAGDRECFIEMERQYQSGSAVSILISGNCNAGQRHGEFMIERQRKAYELVAQCDSENRPVRVIVVKNEEYGEIKGTMKIFIVIKDYDDPIFPAIWGCFIDNASTNDFANVFSDYFLGTHDWGNGRPHTLYDAQQYFPQDEELIVFGSKAINLGIKS